MHARSHPRTPGRRALLALTALAAAALAACGSNDEAPPEPVVLSGGVVAGGPLAGATVCHDLNDNAACDAGEPAGTSDADGRYRFEITQEQAEPGVSHAVVAQVPATAVDKDTGQPVGVAFTLRAPVTDGGTVFVSPLTTLVVELALGRGVGTQEALNMVQAQLGLAASPLSDFVAAGDADAATKARTVGAVMREVARLADAAGVPAAGREALIGSVAAADLSTLAARVASSTASTPAEVARQVSAAVLAERNLSAATVAQQAQVAAALAAPSASDPPGPFVSVRRFTFTDADNHFVQVFLGDSSQLTDGEFVASESRIHQADGRAVAFNRNTAYWNQATRAWEVCPIGYQIVRTRPQTATHPQDSTVCGGSRSLSRVAAVDVAGRRMADVVAEVRASSLRDLPGADTDATGLPVKWGPDPSRLGDQVFPPGARMHPREQTSDVGDSERYSLTDLVRVVPAGGSGTFRQAVVLEDAKRMTGDLADPAAVVGNANTLFLDDLPFDQADPALRDIKRYRAALSGDSVRYYACDVVDATNALRDCVNLGEGRSAIETRGDARVLRFASGYPVALTTGAKRQRQLVERSGGVFGGYRDLERKHHGTRPNTVAWEALRAALGIAAPAAPQPPAGPGPFTVLRSFTFTDAGNYSVRAFTGDSGLLDAQGYFVLDEIRETRSGGAPVPFARNALYWTGTSWFDCGSTGVGIVRVNSQAPFDSLYCAGYADERHNAVTVTLDGRRMADVVNSIRAYGSRDGAFDYARWGPDPGVHTQLAAALFPPGATMEYRGTLRKGTPVVLHIGPNDKVRVPPANASVPFGTWPFAADLEGFVASYPGDLKGGPPNGATTFWVAGRTLPAPPAPELTTAEQYRVAFDPDGRRARFWRNHVAAATGFATNFVPLFDTTYIVDTLADARVLRFAALPEVFERELRYERMFGERQGAVWYASKDRVNEWPEYSIRLNGVASGALRKALGID
jgi:hypothetical protein